MTFIKLSPEQRNDIAAALCRSGLFDAAGAAWLTDAGAGAAIGVLAEGETLFRQDETADYWYLILEGNIETLRVGADGEERVLQQHAHGKLVAPLVMFMPHRRYPVEARASSPSLVCRLRRESLHTLCERRPATAIGILTLAGQTLLSRIDELEQLASASAPQRIAAYLLDLARNQGEYLELPLSQRHLAARLGVRAETLNRHLADWRRDGYIRGQRRKWEIRDPAELRRLAGKARAAHGSSTNY